MMIEDIFSVGLPMILVTVSKEKKNRLADF